LFQLVQVTSIGSDFVIPDENLLEILQVDDDISQENISAYLILEKKNIPLQRYSCDKGRVNKYGNLFVWYNEITSYRSSGIKISNKSDIFREI
jgi:hypothetical protein